MDEFLKIINPATEELIKEVPVTSEGEVAEAVKRSLGAQVTWDKTSPSYKAKMLRALADAISNNREKLGVLESINVGKPINDALDEIDAASEVFYYYAGAVDKFKGTTVPVDAGVDFTFNEPLGVIGAIVPWNFPLLITTWKVAPALACGNSVIVKPAEWTPLSAMMLETLAKEVGFVDSLLQVLPGTGSVTGNALVENRDVSKIAFTGSTLVGKKILAKSANDLKRVTLELGGKSATLVFRDADLEKAAISAPMAVFGNSGQDCCARSRILVEDSVKEVFIELLVNATKSIKVGDPTDISNQLGPVVSAEHLRRVRSFIDPIEQGVTVEYQGDKIHDVGYYINPVVLSAPNQNYKVAREEIFGPVVTVIGFRDEEEAVNMANGTLYGLSGSIWTSNISKALRVARGVKSGTLSINSNSSVRVSTPFGGMNQSGIGRELGMEAMASYSEVKNVFISTNE